MATFITLTDAVERGNVWRLPAGQFVYRNRKYDESGHIGAAVFFFDKLLFVTETPEQIDALLGVTERADAVAELVAAIELVRGIIADAAPEGFNPLAGDWAQRLYESQAVTLRALRAARGE